MNRSAKFLSLALLVSLPTFWAGCKSSDADDGMGGDGSGGKSSTGGKASSGGKSSTGGTSSTGGKSSTGGAAGSASGGMGGGFAGSEGTGSDWLGSTPHLDAAGSVGEKNVDLSAAGVDAADLGTLYCERNYIVPALNDTSDWANEGYLEKVEFKFNFFFEETLAEFQLELEGEGLFSKVGQTLVIGEDVEVALGLKKDVDGPNEEEFEDEARSGSVALELLSGEVGEDGLTVPDGEGAYGAFVDVELESGGNFRGSFTMNCGPNDLEISE